MFLCSKKIDFPFTESFQVNLLYHFALFYDIIKLNFNDISNQ